MKLSAYSLQMFSVPDGRAANHPSAVVTLRPPIEALLPGAFVNFPVIFPPANVSALMSSGDNFPSAAFCSGVAGVSMRA